MLEGYTLKKLVKIKDYGKNFHINYVNNGSDPETKRIIVRIFINGYEIRNTSEF